MNPKSIDPKSASLAVLGAAVVIALVVYIDQSGMTFDLSKLPFPEAFFVGFFFLLAAFLILREIILWYFRINRIVELLEKIEENTRK